MKLYLLSIILLISSVTLAQETDKKPDTVKRKKVELRDNSREQAIVKRDNFHQRRDTRNVQMNRAMRISKQKRNMQNKSLQMQNKNRKKIQTKQQKQRMQKQKQRAIKNRAKR
ncbi:hypothetical protein E9993_03760 [Labilibacter sediminis]|nr:hypothetical protein E9993_03760 [Labilibacter sediminis]